jgi:hypothetical protein
MSDITDAVRRMREMNAALSDWDRIRAEGERISREEGYKVLTAEIATLHAEIDRLRLAIRRLAEQDATLSVQGGNVTVTVDATLTDEERKAVERAADLIDNKTCGDSSTLRGLLERMSGNAALSCSGQSTSTPLADATPDECSVPPEWTSRPYWVDPPAGHRYGFPRLYDPATDGDMTAWMIANGYPERLARQGLACTFTACTETGGK